MIRWSQQFKIVSDVFQSFKNGEKINGVIFSDRDIERGKMFLSPEKFTNFTVPNFTILVLSAMFYKKPTSKIELMKYINGLDKDKQNALLKLKSDVQAYTYLSKQDEETLQCITLNPYEAYKQAKISFFGVNKYYHHHPELIKGRIMKKEVKDINVLVQHFRVSE